MLVSLLLHSNNFSGGEIRSTYKLHAIIIPLGSPESVCISLFFGCYSELFDLRNSLNTFSLNYLLKKTLFFFSSTSMKESCEFRVGIQIVISSKETRTFIIIDSCVRQQQQRKKMPSNLYFLLMQPVSRDSVFCVCLSVFNRFKEKQRLIA